MITIERRFTPQKKFAPDAFRIEYGNGIPEQVIFDDVVSYLGEYRFSLPKYSYTLKFSDGKLRDPHRNDSMEELSQRAIDRKVKEGKSFVREKAELRGFQSLNDELQCAKIGSTIIWASPPGPKEDGYGDYGFVYFGKVETNNLEEKNIKMTAMRVERPNAEQFNRALRMLGGKKEHATAEEFLANPNILAEDLKEGYVDAILKTVFNFKPNEEEQEKFNRIIKRMFPLIWELAKNSYRTKQDLYALENCALKLKRDHDFFDRKAPSRLEDLASVYRDEPPKVAGSCGSTGSSNGIKSSNIFNSLSSLNSLLSENAEWFICPECNYKADGPVGNKCPGCGITKEEFAKSGQEICE